MQNKEQGLFRHQLLLRVASWRSRGVYFQASTMLPGPEFDSMSPQLYGEREYQEDGSHPHFPCSIDSEAFPPVGELPLNTDIRSIQPSRINHFSFIV
jgi:hypothetical protein